MTRGGESKENDLIVKLRNLVMLSAAKHLYAVRVRPFAALRVTRDRYHAERSEAPRRPSRETLRGVYLERSE